MSRFRLYPTSAQEAGLAGHCAHARYVWNLALEQQGWHGRAGRGRTPGYAEQNRQLTEARAAFGWLEAGSVTVQQQALRDAGQAWRNFFAGTHRRPTWRKAGRHQGFRIVGARAQRTRKLNRRWSQAWIPKVGWVRYRRTRAEGQAKSYRVTRDAAGRWHIAFAVVPKPIAAPGNGQAVGVDRGVAIAAALSTGELLNVPGLRPGEAGRLLRLQRRLARARRGSNRRAWLKRVIARLKAREADRRRDWVEKTSTGLARRFDVIRVEDLNVKAMTGSARGTVAEPGRNVAQKAGLNRGILGSGWGQLVRRLEDKAPGRVEKISAAYTSQTCNLCKHVAPESRESQALFRCADCGHEANADVNAARNIREPRPDGRGSAVSLLAHVGTAVIREPQHAPPRVP